MRRRGVAVRPRRELCDELAAREGVAELVRDTTGLVLSPYYPAGKMAWILANVPTAAEAAAAGELCLGTIDAWVVWTLTGGAEFRCDWSNASRTQLFDLRRGCWSEPVCEAFGVDAACLPQVTDSDGLFGMTDLGGFLPAPVPIHGVLGDSHAALFAQGCHSRGMAKATYGTGSSVMMNVSDEFVASSHGLSSSLAWRMDGVTEYVLEGNVSYAGAVKTWLRDDLELINNPEEVTDLCYAANPASRVYFVPAFTGLGAPHWASDAEGCVFGMTRTTGRAEFVKAADESIAYQIFDVIDAMVEDSGAALAELRVDGGPTRDAYLMQFESDLVGSPIRIASNDEMSGLGAAWACGIALGHVHARRRRRLRRPRHRGARHVRRRARQKGSPAGAMLSTPQLHTLPRRLRGAQGFFWDRDKKLIDPRPRQLIWGGAFLTGMIGATNRTS